MNTKKHIKKTNSSSISLSLPVLAGLTGVFAGAVVFWMYQRSKNKIDSSLQEEPLANGNAQGMATATAVHPTEHLDESEDWNRADEASWESFPASDAPSSHNITRSSPVRH